MATFLIMMALGVSREDMIKDYLMTDVFTKKDLRKLNFMIRFFVRDDRKRECYRTLLGVSEAYVRPLFDIIDRDYGGENGYLQTFIGLTSQEIDYLKKLYLTV